MEASLQTVLAVFGSVFMHTIITQPASECELNKTAKKKREYYKKI